MISILFWFFVGLIVYIYIGYPFLLGLLTRLIPRETISDDTYRPEVALVISAFNERAVILEKLRNSINLDYPANKLQIWVVSDASTDGTDQIVEQFSNDTVKLYRLQERQGKTYGITQVMQKIDCEIVVFSDANAIYDPQAVKQLVRYFADPSVGYVVGNARYYKEGQSAAGNHEDTYWNFEIKLKIYESAIGSVVGGDGAIYAIRRQLFKPLHRDDINDFVNPIQIILQGFRGVFNPHAICYEDTADTFMKEYKRKRRIVNRSWRGLWKNAMILNPFKTGIYAWQILSHKLLRWLGGLFVLIVFFLNLMLLGDHWIYALSLAGQLVFYLFSAIGYTMDRQSIKAPVLITIPYYFVMVNLASLGGILDAYSGKTYTTWKTVRERK